MEKRCRRVLWVSPGVRHLGRLWITQAASLLVRISCGVSSSSSRGPAAGREAGSGPGGAPATCCDAVPVWRRVPAGKVTPDRTTCATTSLRRSCGPGLPAPRAGLGQLRPCSEHVPHWVWGGTEAREAVMDPKCEDEAPACAARRAPGPLRTVPSSYNVAREGAGHQRTTSSLLPSCCMRSPPGPCAASEDKWGSSRLPPRS